MYLVNGETAIYNSLESLHRRMGEVVIGLAYMLSRSCFSLLCKGILFAKLKPLIKSIVSKWDTIPLLAAK